MQQALWTRKVAIEFSSVGLFTHIFLLYIFLTDMNAGVFDYYSIMKS